MSNEIALSQVELGRALANSRAGRRSVSPYGYDGGGQGDTQAFDLHFLLRVLREWRWLILAAVGLGIALAVIATMLTKPLYRASVTLEVNPPTVEVLEERMRDSGASSTNTYDFVATQVGLLSSRSLAERVAQDLNLAANPLFSGTEGNTAARLRIATGKVVGGLQVDRPEEGQLIKFTYTSDSPVLAAQVANGVAENFIGAALQRRYEASTYARTFLQQQIARTRRDLEKSERALVGYAQAEQIISTGASDDNGQVSDAGSLQGESLVTLNKALAEATARRVQAEGEYRQSALAGGSSEATGSTAMLRQSKAALEADFQQKRTLMKPDHPDMLSLRSQINELDRQIAAERSQIAGGRATTLLAQFRAAQSAEQALQSRVAQLKGSVLNLRGRTIQYNILQRDVDTNRGLYDSLLQRYKEVGVAGGVGSSPVSIVDRAEPPGGPFQPSLPRNMLIGLIMGFIGGVAIATTLEILNDTITTRDDVRSKLGLACLGAIPKRRGKGPLIEDFNDPASLLSEAYAAVLAALRFSTGSGAPKTMLVASTRASEGKSSSALALAQNSARRGSRVLLIDGDLRRPIFKVDSSTQGLTKLLTNDDHIAGHLVPTQQNNLWLLPCGPVPPNPADLLSTGRMKSILAEAGAQFDMVIVDGPPILGLADASLLASACGNVMMVIESGVTRTRAAREALERLEGTGAHIVGVTLTKSTEEQSGYGYRLYQYGAIDHRRTDVIRISKQAS